MNILVSAFSCDPYSGGEAGNGWNFATKLSGSGHHVLCFTSTEAKENVYKGIKEQNVKNIEFVFMSRIMKEKGIEQYLEAAKHITKKYFNVKFHICGFCKQRYEDILKSVTG